jgi:hypothetical protein
MPGPHIPVRSLFGFSVKFAGGRIAIALPGPIPLKHSGSAHVNVSASVSVMVKSLVSTFARCVAHHTFERKISSKLRRLWSCGAGIVAQA